MALDRTWYNNLLDDDGSNTVGTVWNKYQIGLLLDSMDYEIARLSDRSYCSILATNAQSVPTGAWTNIVYDTEEYDATNMWYAGDASSIFAQVTGVFLVQAYITWGVNATGMRGARVLKTGTTALPEIYSAPTPGGLTTQSVIGMVHMVASDKLTLQGYQASGAPLQAGGFGNPITNMIKVYRIY